MEIAELVIICFFIWLAIILIRICSGILHDSKVRMLRKKAALLELRIRRLELRIQKYNRVGLYETIEFLGLM